MSRIVYAVAGDSQGHVNRALTLCNELKEHEFLFVGGGAVHSLSHLGEIYEVPMIVSHYENNELTFNSITGALPIFWNAKRVITKLARKMEEFSAAIAISDYEYHTPQAANLAGVPSLCVGHQNIQSRCKSVHIPGQTINRVTTRLFNKFFHCHSKRYLLDSFFEITPEDEKATEVYPPVIKKEVLALTPSQGEHILVYLTSPSFEELFSCFAKLGRPVKVYGAGERPKDGLVEYKKPSKEQFLADLASCRFVICNGGHNAISEALFFGKPVLSFPIRLVFEQVMNAHHLRLLQYGDYSMETNPNMELFSEFESRIDLFVKNISQGDFYGTDKVAARIEELITNWS